LPDVARPLHKKAARDVDLPSSNQNADVVIVDYRFEYLFGNVGMLGMMFRVMLRMMLGGMFMVFEGVQLVAMGHLRMMGRGFMIVFVMRLMGIAMMLGGGFEMQGGLFVVVMLRHRHFPPVWTA